MKPTNKAIEAGLSTCPWSPRVTQSIVREILTAAYAAQFQSEDYAGLVKELRDGIIEHRRRFAGDTHDDLGGTADYEKTHAMTNRAADAIEALLAERDALKAELAAANTRMSKLDFERTAAELDRDAERDTLMVVNAELSVAFKERDDAIVERGKWEAAYKEITDTYVKIEETTVDKLKKVEAERDALAARLAPVDDEAMVAIVLKEFIEATIDMPPRTTYTISKRSLDGARAAIAAIRPHIEAAERERCAKAGKEALLKSNYGELHADSNYVNELGEAIAAAIRSGSVK